MAEKTSFLTEAVKEATQVMDDVRRDLRGLVTVPFMQQKAKRSEVLGEYDKFTNTFMHMAQEQGVGVALEALKALDSETGGKVKGYIEDMERLKAGGRIRSK